MRLGGAAMTWRQFREAAERAGVVDSTEISWIDFCQEIPVLKFSKDGSVSIGGRFKTVEEEDAEADERKAAGGGK